MDYLSVDYLIIYAFLFITLAIGLWAGKDIKDMRGYTLANRSFGTVALVLTFLATNMGIINVVDAIEKTGIILSVSIILGLAIGPCILALFVTSKMAPFNKSLTLGDVMGTLYGENIKIITGILGFLTTICIAGMELIVLGLLCESLLGLDYRWGVGLGGLILAVYSAHGGIKAVTATDVFQFLVLLIVLPIITVWALDHAGGIRAVLDQVPVMKMQIVTHPQALYYLVMLILLDILQVGMVDPANIQRLLMARSQRQLRNQFFVLSIISPAVQLTSMLLALTGIVLYPTLEGAQVVPQIIKDLLPVGIKGLAMAGLFAVSMGNIDSYLHAAGITLVHDIAKPICDKVGLGIDELRWAKYATMFVSVFSIAIGLTKTDGLYNLLFVSYECTPILVFPLWSGVLGLKPDKRAFYLAAGVTTVVLLLCKFLLPVAQSHFAVFIGLAANGIVFFCTHAIRNHGFQVIVVNPTNRREYLWKPHRKALLTWLAHLMPTLSGTIQYSQKQVAKYDAPYLLLGIFCVVNYIVPYFMWAYKGTHSELILSLRLVGALACGLLLVRDKWPQSLLPYLPTFWHLTLLYCLPFTSTVMFLLTQGSMEWLINVALTIMFLIVLVDWLSFIMLTVLGVVLGLLFYTLAVGPIALQLDFSTGYLLVYQGIFATLIGLLFARRKQLQFDTMATQRERLAIDNQETKEDLLEATEEKFRFVSVLKKAGIEQLGSVAQLSKKLLTLSKQQGHNKEFTTLAQQLTDQLTPIALSMDRFAHRTTGYLLLDGVETIPFDNFLQAIQQALYSKGHRLKVEVRTQHKVLQCDVEKIKKVILNSVSFIHSVAGEVAQETLLLSIADTQLGYPVDSVISEHIKKISALEFVITTARTLPQPAALYMSQIGEECLMQPDAPTTLPLLANERIVKAHYGYSGTIGTGHGVTLVYVIPVNVREVRSKDMDTPQMKLGASWSRADDTYPGAREQEGAFLQAVQERSKADLALVGKAIQLIKDYHGPIIRESGEPFYLHPLAVAQIVLDYNQEEATLLGALLHDTVEDTPLTLEQIALLFNQEVSTIVQGVTHMESNKDTTYKVLLSHPENIHRLLEAEDKRVLYVKLADRMHNMRTIQAKGVGSQRRTSEETLLFFVPLAKYLHLSEAAEELKRRSFDVLGG